MVTRGKEERRRLGGRKGVEDGVSSVTLATSTMRQGAVHKAVITSTALVVTA
jgi:hypothetical protein